MEWELYAEIRALVDSRNYVASLQMIDKTRSETLKIQSFVNCLEARCHERLGRPEIARAILERDVASDIAIYWTHHHLAALYRNDGNISQAFKAYNSAHEKNGWPESKHNSYTFTHDFFSANIPIWERWFKDWINVEPIEFLEIGSWQGGSATWLLDKIISKRGGRLTCVDPFEGNSEHQDWIGDLPRKIEDIFDDNVRRSGHQDLTRKIKGYSQNVLRSLFGERFDVIYIDGAHESRFVLEDAVLAFGLLRENGFIIFDDYDFKFPENPRQDTSIAIDAFTSIYSDELKILEKGRQVVIQKTS